MIDPRLVDDLAEIAVRQGLAEVEVRHGGLRIRVTRQHAQPAATISAQAQVPAAAPAPVSAEAAAAQPAAAASEGDHPGAIRSPMVGTVYLRPEPNADKFVEVGGEVKQGDRVMLIEAMKTFNDILAPRSGTITSILVNEGEPVEFGEPLFVIE
ncbi:MAG: acetyl-CoA carboxylase biotin carboxyl carrier protein [Hyphomicrobiales bacterium]|nr:acetyl-CoA carboxylase biotin carboxyl carrier protein [Hyphomicrobiales bacterium]